MNRGATLLELLLVLTITGIVLAMAGPAVSPWLDRASVDRAAQELVAAHRRARATAVLESRVALLFIAPDSLLLRVVAGSDTTTRWSAPGPAAAGVSLTGPAYPLRFSPVGWTFGVSNGTYRLTRGRATRQVVVSRLGRVTVR